MSKAQINKMHFIDRANIWFKTGETFICDWNKDEIVYLNEIKKNNTVDDVLSCIKRLYAVYFKDSVIDQNIDPTFETGECSEYFEYEMVEVENEESAEELTETTKSVETTKSAEESAEESIEESAEILSEKSISDLYNELTERNHIRDINITVINLPSSENVKNHIVNFKTVIDIKSKQNQENKKTFNVTNKKKQILNNARIMASEFSAKKSAKQFSKMKISDTGDINTNLLSQYKTSDSIFKSKEIINNEQSHGLIVFIDHSTSMASIISSVRGQALQIAEFCRITNIPFDVYAFSTHPAALNLLKNRSRTINRNYKNHIV
jgi:hypothetical protein